jgi:hypothetical protein
MTDDKKINTLDTSVNKIDADDNKGSDEEGYVRPKYVPMDKFSGLLKQRSMALETHSAKIAEIEYKIQQKAERYRELQERIDIARADAQDAQNQKTIRASEAEQSGIEPYVEKLSNQAESIRVNIVERQQKLFVSKVARAVTGGVKQIGVQARQTPMVAEALGAMESEKYNPTWFNVLQGEKDVASKANYTIQAAKSTLDLENPAGDFLNPAGKELLVEGGKDLAEASKKQVRALAIERQKKSMGLDLESKLEEGRELIFREQGRIEKKDLYKQVSSGKLGNLEEAEAKLAEIGAKLKPAFDAVIETAKKLAEVQNKQFDTEEEKLRVTNDLIEQNKTAAKTQSEINEAYKKQGDVSRAIKETEPPRSKWDMAKDFIGVTTAVTNVAKYQFMTSNFEQMQTRAGYAGVVNKQYDDYISASKGDFSALNRLDNLGFAKKEAAKMGDRAVGFAVAEGVGLAAGAVASGASAVTPGSVLNVPGALRAANAGAGQGVEAAKTGIAGAKGIIRGEAELGYLQTVQNLNDTTKYINSSRLSEIARTGQMMYSGVQGAGTAPKMMENMLDMSSGGLLKTGAKLGFQGQDIARLTSQGISQIGAPFEKQQSAILERAMSLDRSRKLGAEQYVGMTAQLTQVGGSSKQLEDIMAGAVNRGVSGAKVFADMTNAITSMSANLGGDRGINMTDTVTDMMNKSMGTMQKQYGNAMNHNQQIAAAQYGINQVRDLSVGHGQDFATAAQFSNISTAFPDMKPVAVKRLVDTDISQIKNIRDMLDKNASKEKIGAATQGTALGQLVLDDSGNILPGAKENINKVYKNKQEAVANQFGFDTKVRENVLATIQGRGKQTQATMAITEMSDAALKAFADGKQDRPRITTDGTNKKGAMGAAQDFNTATAEAAMKIVDLGTGAKGLSDAFVSAVDRINSKVKEFDPNKMMTDSVSAAGTMTLDTKAFDTSVKSFSDAVKVLVSKISLGTIGDSPASGIQSEHRSFKDIIFHPKGGNPLVGK